MFSKKTRNLTVAVLALIMALTLSFGLFGFNTTQVNAADTVIHAFDGTSASATMPNKGKEYTDDTTGFKYTFYNFKGSFTDVSAYSSPKEAGYYKNAIRYGGSTPKSNSNAIAFTIPKNYTADVSVVVGTYSKTKYASIDNVVKKPDNSYTPAGAKVALDTNNKLVEMNATDLAAGTWYIFGTGDSVVIADLTFTVKKLVTYTYAATGVNNPTDTYVMFKNADISTAGLPEKVTGNYTKTGGGSTTTGTVDLSVTWNTANVDTTKSDTYQVTGTVGKATVEGKELDFSSYSVTTSVKVVALEDVTDKTVNQITSTVEDQKIYFGQEASALNLPTNLNATWTSASTQASGDVVLNVEWTVDVSTAGNKTATGTLTAPDGYTLPENLKTVTANVNVEQIVLTFQATNGTVDTATLNAKYGDKIVTDGNVLTVGTQTVTATANANSKTTYYTFNNWNVANDTAVNEPMTIKASFKANERPDYTPSVSYSAKWDITDSRLGTSVAWDTIYTDKVLANNDGIKIEASSEAISDPKNSSMENCLKAKVGKKFFTVTVPNGFDGKVIIKAAGYNAKSVNVKINNGTDEGRTKDEEYTAKGSTPDNGDDATILSSQGTVEFTIKNTTGAEKTYTVINSDTANNGYVSSIEVTAEVITGVATKYYFVAGEKLYTVAELPVIDGYTFLGWTNGIEMLNAGATVETAGNYTAVYAKLGFVGGSVRKTGKMGFRFMFELELYDVTDAAITTLVAGNITAGKYNIKTSKDNEFNLSACAIKGNKIAMNFVVINEFNADTNDTDKANCGADIVATLSFELLGQNFSATGDAMSITEIAQYAYDNGELTDAVAAKYGVTLKAQA